MFLYTHSKDIIQLQELSATFYADARNQLDRDPELCMWFQKLAEINSKEARILMERMPMKRSRYISYTVEDLGNKGIVSRAVLRDEPMPKDCHLCPFDFYASRGFIQSFVDIEGEIEDCEDKWIGKRGKEAMSAIMKATGGRVDPKIVREYLEDKGLWEETDLF